MKTKWTDAQVSTLFDAYDDYVENLLGYQPLIADLKSTHGTAVEVLDYGCGGGKVTRRLVQSGIQPVTGVDISHTMIEKAKSNSLQQGTRYLQIRSAILPFADDTFDAAVCCYVFINVHAWGELQRIARELCRVLKPGGTLYLLDTNPGSTGIRFSSFQNGDAGVSYHDGDARPVYLDVPGHDVFKIVDTHWEVGTYLKVLHGAGFKPVQTLEHRAADLPDAERSRLGDNEARWPPFVLFKATKAQS
jgi:ubiquinone/menaquinone biosynthesis C-methylase UbiE